MGTTAYGGKGSKERAANGDRPIGSRLPAADLHQGDIPPPPRQQCFQVLPMLPEGK